MGSIHQTGKIRRSRNGSQSRVYSTSNSLLGLLLLINTVTGSASGGSINDGSNNTSGGSSTNVGAIAGGVVGGVLGLALIAGLIWFLLRQRRRRMGRNTAPAPHYQSSADPKYYPVQPVEADSSRERAEMDAEHPMHELPGRGKPARPSSGQVHELDSGGWPKR